MDGLLNLLETFYGKILMYLLNHPHFYVPRNDEY